MLCQVYDKQGKLDQALALNGQVLSMKKHLGVSATEMAATLHNMGQVSELVFNGH